MGLFTEVAKIMFDNSRKKAEMLSRMKGKTEEQKLALRFFLDEGGCFNNKSGKRGGCGKKGIRLPRLISAQEYQNMVQKKAGSFDLKNMALSALGVDESEVSEVDPLLLSGYKFSQADMDTYYIIDREHALTSTFAITVIFFGRLQIYTYTVVFSMISDDFFEFTDEIFYQDITCFTTQKKIREEIFKSWSGCIRKKESAMKKHYTTFDVEIVVPGETLSFTARDKKQAERCIMSMKAMLRERKYAMR